MMGWPGHHRGFLVGLLDTLPAGKEGLCPAVRGGWKPLFCVPTYTGEGKQSLVGLAWKALGVNLMFSDITPVGMLGVLSWSRRGKEWALFWASQPGIGVDVVFLWCLVDAEQLLLKAFCPRPPPPPLTRKNMPFAVSGLLPSSAFKSGLCEGRGKSRDLTLHLSSGLMYSDLP